MASINQETNYITYGQMNLINDLRKLWTELAMWIRSYIISTANDLSNLNAVGKRVYQIPAEFKNTLEIFFGTSLAERFESLLTGQIVIGAEIINAEKAGDRDKVDASTANWYENADEIAALLAQANPYWSEEEWKNLLYEYNRLSVLEMVAIMSGKYDEEAIAIYDRIEDQVLKMADYMAKGIMQYFTINHVQTE